MSHIRPGDKSRKHRRSDCKKGRHDYGEPQSVGAGIVRQVCKACAAVTIDLTQADELRTPLKKKGRSILSMVSRRSK